MAPYGDEPEVWIEDGPAPDSTQGSGPDSAQGSPGGGTHDGPSGGTHDDIPPNAHPGDGPRGGWGRARWVALAAGFAVLLSVIALQHQASGGDQAGPAPGPAVTPPATTSTSTTPSAPESLSTSPAHSSSPSTISGDGTSSPSATGIAVAQVDPTPSTVTMAPAGLPGAPFTLVGLMWDGDFGSLATLFTYRSDTGVSVLTEVSSTLNHPLSFFTTADGTVVDPWGGLGGYVVPAGQPAVSAEGVARSYGPIFPSTDPRRVWAPTTDYQGAVTYRLTDVISGHAADQTIALPSSVGTVNDGTLTPDGAGHLLARTVGGVYELSPGMTQLVTHGSVLAAGPTGYLVYDCDKSAHCAAAVVDRTTGKHTELDGYSPDPAQLGRAQGVISPDGHYAALLGGSGGTMLIDLHTGTSTSLNVFHASLMLARTDATSLFAFTPDSGTLLVAATGGVTAVDTASGTAVSHLLAGPSIAAIAIGSEG